MVSFQCDACQDVVKKPKLDAHSYKCSASFTCVDCSKTFWTQPEWKAHTSCISEAEKYQKGLYKGNKAQQKNGSSRQQNDHHDKSKPTGNDVTRKSNIEQQDSTLRDAAGNSGPVKSKAPISGTTDTQVSRITATIAAPDKESRKEKKKRKADGSHAAPKDDTPADGVSQKKKRKLDAADNSGETERDANVEETPMKKDEVSGMHPALQGSETSAPKKEKKSKKKKARTKKDKMASTEEGGTVETVAPPVTDSLVPALNPAKESDQSEKKKRKSNEDKPNALINEATSSPEDTSRSNAAEKKKKKDKMKKERKQESTLDTENGRAASEDVTSSKERKRPSRKDGEGTETAGTKKVKKEKKEKKGKKGGKEKGTAEQETNNA